MPFRIEVAALFTDRDEILGKANPPGGAFVARLSSAVGGTPAATVSETAEDLRSRIEDHLQAYDSDFVVYQGTGTSYAIEKDDAFDLYLSSRQSLAEFLGLPTTDQTGTTSVSGGQAPSIFEGERAAVVTTGWRWQLRRTDVSHGEARSVKLSKQQIYRVTLQVTRDELKQYRETERYLLLGLPFTLCTELDAASVNGFNMNAYSATNLGGRIYMQLDAAADTLSATQLTDPYQSDVSIEFNATAVTTPGGTLSLSE